MCGKDIVEHGSLCLPNVDDCLEDQITGAWYQMWTKNGKVVIVPNIEVCDEWRGK